MTSRRSQQSIKDDEEISPGPQSLKTPSMDDVQAGEQKQSNDQKISSCSLYSLFILMLFFGTCNTVIMKMQDNVVVGTNPDGTSEKFNHPYFQCALMFVGELFCLAVYGMKRMIASEGPSGREGLNPAVVAFPAMFDICGSSMMFVALTMCAASVYQMMRGVIVVITAVMAIIFLGRKQYTHHWLSLTTIVLGVFIVGFVNIMASKGDSTADQTSIIGIILLLVAQCFTGGQFIVEEKILGGQNLDPLYIVGLEGLWGVLISAILLPIFQNIECDGQLCHHGKIEDSLLAIDNFRNHPILILQSAFNIITIAGFNWTGVMVTKHASAAQRSTIDTCRTMVIWAVFLALGKEKFLAGQLMGFAILLFGTLVYNEIIEVPIGFMNYNTKANIEAREKQEAIKSNKGKLSNKEIKETVGASTEETVPFLEKEKAQ